MGERRSGVGESGRSEGTREDETSREQFVRTWSPSHPADS